MAGKSIATAKSHAKSAPNDSAHLCAGPAHEPPVARGAPPAQSSELALLSGTATARSADQVDVDALARVFATALLVDMPSQGQGVRMLVGRAARHAALAARFDARGRELGVDTPEAIAMLREADREDRRAEQCLLSAFGLAEKAALKRPGEGGLVVDVRQVDEAAEAALRGRRGASSGARRAGA